MKAEAKFSNPKNINLENYLSAYGVADIKEYLNPTTKYLDSCFDYENMDMAMTWIKMVIESGTNCKVAIVCDSDVDGIMSSALAHMFLKEFTTANIDIICHTKKQHGLKDVYKDLTDYDFIWLPDAGTNDDWYCTCLYGFGAKILITDHHQKETENPNAIVVNNQSSLGIKNKSLCGTGVTFQAIKAWCIAYDFDWYLDKLCFVAIANIADSCSMISYENRAFNKFGLSNITHPFLKAMINRWVRGDELIPKDIAWGVAPKLNALCRSNNQELKHKVCDMFIGEHTDVEYDDILKKLESCHRQQRNDVNNIYNDIIQDSEKVFGGIVFKTIEPTRYTGLVANKLMDYYSRPIVLVSKNKDNTLLQGSVRSTVPLRKAMNESGLFEVCTGHEQAYGVEFDIHNTQKILDYCTELNLDISPIENVTCSVENLIEIPSVLYEFTDKYKELWGKGIPEPTIHLKDVIINSNEIKELGTSTIKFRIGMTDIVKFSCSNNFKNELCIGENKKLKLSFVGFPTLNEWNGNVTRQIVIDKIDIEVI